jgi:hypothetical protein
MRQRRLRATLEKNGGVHEDTRNGKRRYWIETAPSNARRDPLAMDTPF